MSDPAVSSETTFLAVVAFILAWVTLYLTLRVFQPQCSAEWHCRLVTVVHATTVLFMSSWCGFIQGPWPFSEPGGPNTVLQHWTVTLSFGYFIFDLGWCLYFRTEGGVMLFHHCLTIMGEAVCLYRHKYGTEMIATIFGTELSNPLLQLRWFLRELDLHRTWYAELNDVAFMCVFGICRIILASYLLYTYLSHPVPDAVGKFGGICIYSIGWIFWFAIVRYAIRKYGPRINVLFGRSNGSGKVDQSNGRVSYTAVDRTDVSQSPKKVATAETNGNHINGMVHRKSDSN